MESPALATRAHAPVSQRELLGLVLGCGRSEPAKRTMTAGAVLIDIEERMMHVANGPPCSNEYVAFRV